MAQAVETGTGDNGSERRPAIGLIAVGQRPAPKPIARSGAPAQNNVREIGRSERIGGGEHPHPHFEVAAAARRPCTDAVLPLPGARSRRVSADEVGARRSGEISELDARPRPDHVDASPDPDEHRWPSQLDLFLGVSGAVGAD